MAVSGAVAFALAGDFASLVTDRALIGVGVRACLTAPLTAFRRSFDTVAELRANPWMLMSGSVGMAAGLHGVGQRGATVPSPRQDRADADRARRADRAGGTAARVDARPAAGAWVWVLFCAGNTSVPLSQPAVGMALSAALAGRALSACNLVIFLGVFTVQWSIGIAIDALRAIGWNSVSACRGGFALLKVCCLFSYVWFLCRAEPTPASELNRPH